MSKILLTRAADEDVFLVTGKRLALVISDAVTSELTTAKQSTREEGTNLAIFAFCRGGVGGINWEYGINRQKMNEINSFISLYELVISHCQP